MNVRSLAAALGLLGVSLAASCAQPTGSANLATFSGGVVEVAQLDSLMLALPEAQRRPPTRHGVSEWLGELVLDIALEEALLARARRQGFADDPGLRLRARYLASRKLGAAYAQERCPDEEVTDAEVEQVFSQKVSREPRDWVLLRHIFRRVPSAAPAGRRAIVRAEMEALLEQIERGASFIDLAMEHSDSETAAEGGLIGRVSRAAPMEPAVLEAGWSLPDGGHSGIVEVPNGFHIVRRDASGTEQPPTLEEARARLRLQVARERRERCGSQLVIGLAEASGAVIDPRAALDPAAGAAVFTVGEERFTADQLQGLSEDSTPIAELQNLAALLQSFAEALLLAEAARAHDPAAEGRYAALETDAFEQLLLAHQWRSERLRVVAARPIEELEAYFNMHHDWFAADAMVDLSVIVIYGSRPADDRKAHERAWAARDRIVGSEPFADVAREVSAHSSREQGGRLGRVPLPRLRSMLGSVGYRAAAGLEPGQVSQPFRVTGPPAPSWALVCLHEREPPAPRAFEDARSEVIEALAGEGVQILDRELRGSLREEIGFRLNRRVLTRYVRGLGAGGE